MKKESVRHHWVAQLHKIAFPVIDALSRKQLREELPLPPKVKTRGVAYLEAFGRTLTGLAPWLVSKTEDEWEQKLQEDYIRRVRLCLDACTDPESPDYFLWKADERHSPNQPLVDAAYFVSGLLKAREVLWEPLEERVQENIRRALEDVTKIRSLSWSNWLMFSAMVEAGLYALTGKCDTMKLEFSLFKMDSFYLGDGTYGDGESFAWDYYNSYVMQPLLEEVTRLTQELYQYKAFGATLRANVLRRMQRYCEVQERLISPDGSYVATGRSSVYRMAAFQSMAHLAWQKRLPPSLPEGQVRAALQKVTDRLLTAPTLFDEKGFLRAGLYGYQPAMQDSYINTGSLYMCCAVFLPLGLHAKDSFWQCGDLPTTWEKAWSGQDIPYDTAKD